MRVEEEQVLLSLRNMKRSWYFLTIAFLLTCSLPAISQISLRDSSVTIPMVSLAYSYQLPAGDMADRYGSNSYIAPGFQVKLASQWYLGAEAGFILGANVKPGFNILSEMLTSEGNIINGDGVPAVVALFERGFVITGKFGRLFPLGKKSPNSGLLVNVSAGYMQHKIKIDVENKSAPQLKDDYSRGYDRLTSGFLLGQSVGYLYMGTKRLLNFYFGIEVYEGFTKGKREYLFDLMSPDNESRLDILVGPKISWFIPFYKRAPEEYYFY
jgi:hypothetical protein